MDLAERTAAAARPSTSSRTCAAGPAACTRMTEVRPAMAPILMRPEPGQPRPAALIAHRDRVGHVELGVLHDAGEHQRHDDVEHRADGERAEDADRHVALRVLGLLRRGGDRVEPDVGEEHDARAARPCRSSRMLARAGVGRNERLPVGRVDVRRSPSTMNRNTTASLMNTITLLTLADSQMPIDQQGRDQRDDDHRRHVEDRGRGAAVGQASPPCLGRPGQCGRNVDADVRRGTRPRSPTSRWRRSWRRRAYSRIRSQPMIQATNSPSVA